ncbi:hypothetical protein F2P46_06285 [Massilia sp. CCM 8734]|nr:hypothetical protein [Massilia sp. CCM 8734]
MSLQTIVFDRMEESEFPPFITEKIFPGSMLPQQREILAASDRVLSLVNVRNDALDYARTCQEWVQRIEAAKPELITMVGADKTNEYVQYLRMSAAAFERQQFGLLRLKFRSYANACPPISTVLTILFKRLTCPTFTKLHAKSLKPSRSANSWRPSSSAPGRLKRKSASTSLTI